MREREREIEKEREGGKERERERERQREPSGVCQSKVLTVAERFSDSSAGSAGEPSGSNHPPIL